MVRRSFSPQTDCPGYPIVARRGDQYPVPLMLNTGRIRDQWHTMTRTGYVARLMQHIAEPLVDICRSDAARYGVCEGQLARIASARGVMVARIHINDAQKAGELFLPMHWNAQFSRQGRSMPWWKAALTRFQASQRVNKPRSGSCPGSRAGRGTLRA